MQGSLLRLQPITYGVYNDLNLFLQEREKEEDA
jgi:hypothetical protein